MSEHVQRLALEWAAADPWESWIYADGQPLSSSDLRDIVEDYLTHHDPFPDGTRVETRGLDADQHVELGVIVGRPGHDEWTVDFDDGGSGWRGHDELRIVEAVGA